MLVLCMFDGIGKAGLGIDVITAVPIQSNNYKERVLRCSDSLCMQPVGKNL